MPVEPNLLLGVRVKFLIERVMPPEMSQAEWSYVAGQPTEAAIFGTSAAMHRVRKALEGGLQSSLPVILEGESGTGKEVIARLFHARSNGPKAPFVKVACGAVSPDQLEDWLLGQGADAGGKLRSAKRGFLKLAEGGTLFLDGADEVDWARHGKLRKLLEERLSSSAEGMEPGRARTRLVCAVSAKATWGNEAKASRSEFLRAVDGVRVHLPALRERKDDIPQLCEFFMDRLAEKFGKEPVRLPQETLDLLMQWDWPGNLRELENVIASVLILGSTEALKEEMKGRLRPQPVPKVRRLRAHRAAVSSKQTVASETAEAIRDALEANHWNRRKTAEQLHMSYRALQARLRGTEFSSRRKKHAASPPSP